VTFVASFGYGPNRDAARFLLDSVWPRLRRAEPDLVMRLVGRQAAALPGVRRGRGVDVISDPPTIERYYREASIVVAPVDSGGGARLKVTEALARHRVVVATPFSARAAPAAAGAGLVVAARDAEELADSVLRLWRDVGERRVRERALVERRPVPAWEEACRPLVGAMAELVLRR
jgi:glycosyltransferase involved in cell wall biosynthesis